MKIPENIIHSELEDAFAAVAFRALLMSTVERHPECYAKTGHSNPAVPRLTDTRRMLRLHKHELSVKDGEGGEEEEEVNAPQTWDTSPILWHDSGLSPELSPAGLTVSLDCNVKQINSQHRRFYEARDAVGFYLYTRSTENHHQEWPQPSKMSTVQNCMSAHIVMSIPYSPLTRNVSMFAAHSLKYLPPNEKLPMFSKEMIPVQLAEMYTLYEHNRVNLYGECEMHGENYNRTQTRVNSTAVCIAYTSR